MYMSCFERHVLELEKEGRAKLGDKEEGGNERNRALEGQRFECSFFFFSFNFYFKIWFPIVLPTNLITNST